MSLRIAAGRCLLIWGIVTAAQAQNGSLLNVSVLGDARWDEPQVGCTIVDGFRALAVLAEAETAHTDPYLEVRNLFDPNPNDPTVLSNDDWRTLITDEKEILRNGIGRLPNRSTDAAILMTATNAAVCAEAYEDVDGAPAGRISVQITDITASIRSFSDQDGIRWLINPQ